MVIPRSRSSGALSIESNARNCTLGLFLDSTLVIAAVNVVFPWSMWPIVPMLTCGLFRSNFSLAIVVFAPQPVLRISALCPPAWMPRHARPVQRQLRNRSRLHALFELHADQEFGRQLDFFPRISRGQRGDPN